MRIIAHSLIKYPLIAVIAVAMSFISITAHAGSHATYAKVIKVTPIYKTVYYGGPHRKCYRSLKRINHKRIGAILDLSSRDSIASNTLHTYYHDRNRHRYDDRNRRYHDHSRHRRIERACHKRHLARYKKRVKAYKVKYRYRGRTYHTVMNRHPGNRIRVTVDVHPY